MMATIIPTQKEKCIGAMIATAIGDALGWPNELRAQNTISNAKFNDNFVEWTRRCGRPNWHYEKILPGEYSDDTQMTLSVARSLIAGNWEDVFINKELPFWLDYERGGGRALLKAANSCKKGVVLWASNNSKEYFNAGGNGAAMRILPHVIISIHSNNTEILIANVIKNAIITHGHPRAILGATCYAFALDYLLRKESKLEYGQLVSAIIDGQNIWGAFPNHDEFTEWNDIANRQAGFNYAQEWNNTLSNMVNKLDFIMDSLKKGLMLDDSKVLTHLECFDKASGAGDVAILTAIYLTSRYANNPVLGIKIPAFSVGADTDTIASMTGGLLGMLSGINWIPNEWRIVQDYSCLMQITELLLVENSKEATRTVVAGVKAQVSGWQNTPIGLMRILDKFNIQNGKNTTVIVTKKESTLGQTMHFKEYIQNKSVPNNAEIPRQQQLSLHDVIAQQLPDSKNKVEVSASVQKPLKEKSAQQKVHHQFILNSDSITDLLNNPQFKNNITIGKVLKIIQALIANDQSKQAIAKRFEITPEMVTLICSYIKE